MGALFSKKKPQSRVTEQDKAVLQLKQTRDKIKQYQKRVELSIAKDRELVKRLVKDGQKDRALLLLRKKKYQEQTLSRADGQVETLERMMQDIEFAQIETRVVDGLKDGNEALKKLHEMLSIDEIERVMDDTREAVEKQQEIDEMLSGALTNEEEGEVEAELDDMLAKELEDSAPLVPSDELPETPEQEEEEKPKEKTKRREKQPSEPVALEA